MTIFGNVFIAQINRSEKQITCVPVSGTIKQHSRCVLFAFLAGVVCFSPQTIADSKLAKVQAVSVVDASINRVFFGRVAARETVDLAFQVGGQIVDFPVTEGEIIPADSMIAKLDLEPYQLSLDQAKAQFSQADRTFKRLNTLAVDGVSQTSVDDAETQVQLTRIALSNAERSVRQATLNAPFNAMIATKLVANFSSIAAGTPVVRIHDMSALRIEIDVPELLVQRAGRDPNVEIEAVFPTSEKRYPLELLEFNAETAQVGQTFKVAFTMEPPDNLLVLPGSSARVHVNIKLGEPRVEIPASALILENDGSASVMLFEPVGAEEGTVRKTGIEIAATSNGAVEVVAGLEAGQEIIVSGAAALDDGAQVTRFGGFDN